MLVHTTHSDDDGNLSGAHLAVRSRAGTGLRWCWREVREAGQAFFGVKFCLSVPPRASWCLLVPIGLPGRNFVPSKA